MSDEIDNRRDNDSAIQIALFRYGVLGPLVERADLGPGEVSQLIREIAAHTHYLPGKGPITVSERTVYGWLRLYRTGGLEALRPRLRRDRGKSRKLSEEVVSRAVALRKENPKRWTSTVIDILRLEGTLGGSPEFHRATLDRHLDRRGASRRRLRVLGKKPTIKMRFASFGDLWVGDYHHGPLVRMPDGKTCAAKLGAFIDHTTRYPVADRYYLAENLASLRDCLLRALLAWGLPKKVYVDRGAVYRAEQLAYSLGRLKCKLVHSRAYYSEGRGVIERWWQHADQFESEVSNRDELLTLHEL
ncbi:helix-turn-helix domain-containing protein, partial [Planctomycetota bacterium]